MFGLFRRKQKEKWIVQTNRSWEEVWPGMAGDEHIRRIYTGATGIASISGRNISVKFDDVKAAPYNDKLVILFEENSFEYHSFDWVKQISKAED